MPQRFSGSYRLFPLDPGSWLDLPSELARYTTTSHSLAKRF
jgi:hypothetical protein